MKKLLLFAILAAMTAITAMQSQAQNDTIVVNKPATFEGKQPNNFYNWAVKQLHYPKDAVARNAFGQVAVNFLISTDGSISQIHINGDVDKALAAEAVRVVKLSPKWEPAMREVKLKDGTVISSTPIVVETTVKFNFAITPEQIKSLAACGSVVQKVAK